jgi:hypothetical protein
LVKKAFQSMNFHDLTLGKRSALERRAFHFYQALARALGANFRPSASVGAERVHHWL